MLKDATKKELNKLIDYYKEKIGIMESDANASKGRAYGGVIRQAKGSLQEQITKRLIEIAWCNELGQSPSRLEINSKKIPIPINIKGDYLNHEPDYVKDHIHSNLDKYVYKLSVDKHVFIDGNFVLGIECKAYTENAMIKRIMVDFMLLKTKYPNLKCFLFQLESMLGGDYSDFNKLSPLGGTATHSIMSYFDTVHLHILTLLEGERKVNAPINKPGFHKPLEKSALEKGIRILVDEFKKYAE